MSLWCHETIRVHIEGPGGPRDVVVEQPFAQVGYGAGSQVVLEGPGVRKRALLLLATKLGVYALNLDRAEAPAGEHGTWVTGDEPLPVGPYQLTIGLASGKVAAPGMPDLALARCPLPIPVLHVFGDGVLKDRRRLRHPLTLIGRRPQCSLQLRGEKVSSYHAALYWQDHRLWCFDLASGNGTLLNGAPLVCSELQLNDQLEVGEFGLLYYRWSPRHTTPGMEHLPQEDDQGLWDASPAEIAPDASALKTALAGQEAELRERVEAEFQERLAAEREALEVKRQSLAAAQAKAEQERASLQAELTRLKAELAAARHQITELENRAAAAELQSEAPSAGDVVPAPHFEVVGESAKAQASPETAAAEWPMTETSDQESESAAIAFGPAANAVEPAAAAVSGASVIAIKPSGRRRAQPREELTSFVSGRLGDMEHAQRRRMLLIWSAAVAGTLALLGTAWGIWTWIG